MLDINLLRENPKTVLDDLRKRGDEEKEKWVDEAVKKDEEYRKLLQDSQQLRKKRNEITSEIDKLRREKKDTKKKIEEAKKIPAQIKELEKKTAALKERINFLLMRLPNIMHKSVPVGKDDSENVEIKKWGKPVKPKFKMKPHGEFLQENGLADFERAAKVSGTGFYFLMGDLALLEQAITQFAIKHLVKKGYTLVEPPLMIRREAYETVTDLGDFESVMYKIDGEDLYLIATSEHPMGAMYMNEIIDEDKLPIKFAGISPCFRKEIGAHGVDTRGIFRVHQFNKIEQFIFSKPEDSWKLHEELLKNAEEIFQALEIPYRVVSICTGDIGTVAAKKYDIEAWMPREGEYKEVVSCSNCTAYQAVRGNIKIRRKNGDKEYAHTLNSTAIATSRAIRAIVENFQEEDGRIRIPKALQHYMDGKEFIGGKK
ncbi:MAG: serine--tRNA ligase [Candidatus Diapherotrites archaeon]